MVRVARGENGDDRADTLQAFGECHITDTLMRDVPGQERLARDSLNYLEQLRSTVLK